MKHALFMRDTFLSLNSGMQYRYLERIGILTDRDLKDLPDSRVADNVHDIALDDCGLLLV